jgi:hypothetical protein
MPDSTNWEERPDGARSRKVNGIRVTVGSKPQPRDEIAHLVAHRESGGALVVIGLNSACRPVYQATL